MNSQPDKPATISQDDARRSEPQVLEPDPLALKEKHNHEKGMSELEAGWLGVFLGSKSEKPGNVAFIAIIFCFIFIILAFCLIDTKESDFFMKILASMMSVISLALGYLFGSSDRK